MTYKVEITETLQKIIEIDAKDAETALCFAKQLYRSEEIVLDYSDYVDTEIDIIQTWLPEIMTLFPMNV